MAIKNALAQAKWYRQQKNDGIIYGLYIDGLLYVGSTTNSLKKRLWQHRSGTCPSTRDLSLDSAVIFSIEELKPQDNRFEKEQHWIDTLKPELNKVNAVRRRKPATGIYKGGVMFDGVFYKTKKALWEAVGKTGFPTFKVRLHRYPNNIPHALGLEPSPFRIKSKLV